MFMMLNMLISRRIVASLGLPSALALARWIFFLECLMSTLMTVTKMTTLKAITASTGASRAPARTSTRPMKQLQETETKSDMNLLLPPPPLFSPLSHLSFPLPLSYTPTAPAPPPLSRSPPIVPPFSNQ